MNQKVFSEKQMLELAVETYKPKAEVEEQEPIEGVLGLILLVSGVYMIFSWLVI